MKAFEVLSDPKKRSHFHGDNHYNFYDDSFEMGPTSKWSRIFSIIILVGIMICYKCFTIIRPILLKISDYYARINKPGLFYLETVHKVLFVISMIVLLIIVKVFKFVVKIFIKLKKIYQISSLASLFYIMGVLCIIYVFLFVIPGMFQSEYSFQITK